MCMCICIYVYVYIHVKIYVCIPSIAQSLASMEEHQSAHCWINPATVSLELGQSFGGKNPEKSPFVMGLYIHIYSPL